MHLGSLKRTRIKTYCSVINTVMLEDVCAKKEETITNLIGMTHVQEGITQDGIVLWRFGLVFLYLNALTL